MRMSSNFMVLKQMLDHETINDKLEELATRVRSVSQPPGDTSFSGYHKREDRKAPTSNTTSILIPSTFASCPNPNKIRTQRQEVKCLSVSVPKQNCEPTKCPPANVKKIKSSRISYYGLKGLTMIKENNDVPPPEKCSSLLIRTFQSKIEVNIFSRSTLHRVKAE